MMRWLRLLRPIGGIRRDMTRRSYNWIKHNKKLLKAGEMKEDRVALFERLLEMGERYRRVNQYE